MHFFGLIVNLFFIIAALALGNILWISIDYPSIIFVLFGLIAMMLMSFSLKNIFISFSSIKPTEQNQHDYVLAIYFWKAMIRNLLTIGTIGTLIGGISMLQNITDPAAIGPSLSVSLVTFFYSIVLIASFILPIYFTIASNHWTNNHKGEPIQEIANPDSNAFALSLNIVTSIIGYFLFISLVLSAMLLGGSILAFIDAPSLLIVIGCTFNFALFYISLSKKRYLMSYKFGQFLSIVFFTFALVGVFAGIIGIATNFSSIEMIGPSMAVLLLSLLIGLLGNALISYPMKDHAFNIEHPKLTEKIPFVWYTFPLVSIFFYVISITTLIFGLNLTE